jgi:acyl carrier protein
MSTAAAVGTVATAEPEAGTLPRVRAELLDCLQANLALLADRHHGAGTHLRLGAKLRFSPRDVPGGTPTVEPSLDAQLAQAEALLGLVVTARAHGVRGAALAAAEEPVYVVADAFHLPWLPYHGRRHVEHSFLVVPDGDGLRVDDAYHNDTQWGSVRPSRRRYSRTELADLIDTLPAGAETVRLAPRTLGPAPEPVCEADGGKVALYLEAYATQGDRAAVLERLTLETWLLARARKLHAAYAAGPAGVLSESVQQHLSAWDSVVEHTYLVFRRVARGRPESPDLPARLGAALGADATVFGTGLPEAASPVRDTVKAVVGTVLGVPDSALEQTELAALPEFSSLRMVEIVELLEQEFAVEFAAADLVPERLHRIDDLCGLVEHTRAAARSGLA